MPEITPFTIEIPKEQIDDLHNRIRNTRWPEAECVDDWSQGIPLTYTKELTNYWLTEYDWRTCETKLNSFDQYKKIKTIRTKLISRFVFCLLLFRLCVCL